MVVRLPIQSAKGPAITAPKKVPAERIEVMRDFWVNESVPSYVF